MRHYRSSAIVLTLLASTALAAPAAAQIAPPAPVRQSVDGNSVDLFSGTYFVAGPALSIGNGEPQSLSYFGLSYGVGWTDNLSGGLVLTGTTMKVSLGLSTDRFTVSGSTYTNTEGNGSTLSYNGTTKIYTYTQADGTVVHFSKDKANGTQNEGVITDILAPSGEKLTYNYQSALYCKTWKYIATGAVCLQTGYIYRVTSVRNNFGYVISFSHTYNYTYDPDFPENQPDLYAWYNVPSHSTQNLASAVVGSLSSQSFGTVYEAGSAYFQVTDSMGRQYKYRLGTGGLIDAVRLPGSASNDVTISYTGTRVHTITTPAGVTTYAASDLSGIRTVTVTDPLTHVTTYKFNIASERMTEMTDANGHTTAMLYDGNGRLTRTTQPEGNYVQLTYDSRGNVTQQKAVAKSGSGLADIITSASYPATCTNVKTCNQPTTTTDARGKVTDYTYDSGHGGVLTVTQPAPTTGAVRPQTRYSYSSLQAYFKVGGSIVASGEPVTMLTGTSSCQTLASCTGAADETKSTISYGPQTTGVGNNLLPVLVSQGSGDGVLTATTAYTYDDVGNLTYVDGPLAGTADTTRALYNANRETVGIIGPDPDGAGALKNRARRVTIDPRGLVTKQENGTTAGQTDPAWAAFVPAEAVSTTYDNARRPVTSVLSNGATNYALTQTGYDAASRVDCTTTRMNPAIYASLPASACTLGTQGSFGPDRITKTIYDNANQVTQVQVAVGTADQANERTLTYSNNGRLATLRDAENNLTTYEYDGFDRLSKTRMPNPAQGSGTSSTTDYEQLTYDAASNVTNRRLRDAQNIGFTYDNLNRVTIKNLPGTEPDVTYAYDNLGRLTSASQTGNALSFTYDALSRNLTQAGPQGTVSSQWDIGGRRTKLTYPGSGLYVDYDYLVTGETTKIRENGATGGVGVLATYGYDDLGRRTSLTFGNGAVQNYTFDAVSRLASLTQNPSGTTNDLTITINGYNPASQITSQTRSNDLYAWTGHGNGATASVANGLNQLASIGGTATTHDTKGNVTFDPMSGKTYTYSSENLLTSSSGGTSATLSYDPAMRLYQVAGPATRRFQYDGVNLIAEYDGSNNLQRRYVFGPGLDEPLVQYDGSGTTNRSWLHADERGSIIAVSNGTGAVTQINKYDEYGKPQSTNVGLFQYTGQIWLEEVGAYYYKARIYSPVFGGRFLQTDPIGAEGGMNLYAYVLNDPINGSDPTGLVAKANCTGSLVCSGGRSYGSRIRSNGVDLSAVDMAQANGLREIDPGISGGAINQIISCMNSPSSACMNAPVRDQIADYYYYNAGAGGDALEIASNIQDLRRVGLKGEKAALQSFLNDGYKFVSAQVYVKTRIGLRITDLLLLTPGGRLIGVEVKTGLNLSGGISLQLMKDSNIARYGGQIRSFGPFLNTKLKRGDIVRYETLWVYEFDMTQYD